MISAFKHIRLSGYNLTPVGGVVYDGSSTLRLGFGNSGLAYYSELTGISGFLRDLINTSNADVSKLNNLQGDLYITGSDGITIDVNPGLGEIKIVGNSGYFQAITDSLSSRLNQSGTIYYDTFATQTNLFNTGSALSNYNIAYSGWANAEFVKKSTQQVFETSLSPTDLDAYAIIYPVPFATTPKIQATLEVPGDVMYNLSIRSIGTDGYTGILSDNVLEAGAKIHTFASTQ
jgi:hypothetical protein